MRTDLRPMATRCRSLLGAILVLSAEAVPVLAQPEFSGMPPPGAPAFDLDWAAFRIGRDSARVEVYYRITNPHLSYVRRSLHPGDTLAPRSLTPADTGVTPSRAKSKTPTEYFAAAYEIEAILSEGKDQQVASASGRENYTLPTFEETRNSSGYLVNSVTMRVVPGDYRLSVTLTDRISNSSYNVSRSVDLRTAKVADWMIGGPLFFDPDAVAPNSPRFQRAGVGVVPNVTRAFAGLKDRVAAYIEVYTQDHPEAARLLAEVNQRLGHHHRVDTLALEMGRGIIPVFYRQALPGFDAGEARLRLTVLDSLGRPVGDPVEAGFNVDWSLGTLISDNWDEAVDMLVHVASHDELKKLRATPPDQRAAAFEAFWKSKDPSPETPGNEWEEEYYRRVRYADLHFTSGIQRGWRTDFGTVYIKYGEPDEIERHPFERGSKPYQVWHYYTQNRHFLFVDTRGSGDYELQYPYDGIAR